MGQKPFFVVHKQYAMFSQIDSHALPLIIINSVCYFVVLLAVVVFFLFGFTNREELHLAWGDLFIFITTYISVKTSCVSGKKNMPSRGGGHHGSQGSISSSQGDQR